MQVHQPTEPAAAVDEIVRDVMPDQRGADAWRSFLQAHASLMRDLATDLVTRTGMTLGDFDALIQLALAGGSLRMTDLAARAYTSRSGMTRRVDRLVDDGLVTRTSADADGRGVVVALSEPGLARLLEALPVHLERVSKLFVEPLDDQDLTAVQQAMAKITVDCEFG